MHIEYVVVIISYVAGVICTYQIFGGFNGNKRRPLIVVLIIYIFFIFNNCLMEINLSPVDILARAFEAWPEHREGSKFFQLFNSPFYIDCNIQKGFGKDRKLKYISCG